MTSFRYTSVFAGLIAACTLSAPAAQVVPAPASVPAGARAESAFTLDEVERFLQEAKILSSRRLSTGVTNSRRATLASDRLTHDAHVQVIDDTRDAFVARGRTEVNFRDSYKYNIAAYRLARRLGLDHVPVSVERSVDGRPAAVTWWVDDVAMDEGERSKKRTSGGALGRIAQQIQIMYVFDELIQNVDRNLGNLLWTSDWKMWMIDHTRAFRLNRSLRQPDRLDRCERSLFSALHALTPDAVAEAVGNSLTPGEIEAVAARANLLVKHYEAKIAERGEDVVLFALTTP